MPKLSSKDIIAHTTEKLRNALQNLQPETPFYNIGLERLQALEQLSDMFSQMAGTSKEESYKQYMIPSMEVPTRAKTAQTEPPPRVQHTPHYPR
eukprot:15237651-Ditylum_brightwellii.AAC.1